jgi:hypothetical protein
VSADTDPANSIAKNEPLPILALDKKISPLSLFTGFSSRTKPDNCLRSTVFVLENFEWILFYNVNLPANL